MPHRQPGRRVDWVDQTTWVVYVRSESSLSGKNEVIASFSERKDAEDWKAVTKRNRDIYGIGLKDDTEL
jgi:hypothetical protein